MDGGGSGGSSDGLRIVLRDGLGGFQGCVIGGRGLDGMIGFRRSDGMIGFRRSDVRD